MKKRILIIILLFITMIFVGCQEKEYLVSFEENGGSLVEDYYVKKNENIKLPTIEKEGYAFGGWYLDNAFTKKATEEAINENITVYAKWNKCTEGLTFALNVDEKGYSIESYDGTDKEIIIPSEYKGLPVTAIKNKVFQDYTEITSVIIPESVESIGKLAFSSCVSLESIEISNNVSYIGSEAFLDCENIIIYCKASSQPESWDADWNYSDRPVFWSVEMLEEKDGIIYKITGDNASTTKYVGSETEVEIPNTITINDKTYNVTTIGVGTFSETQITSIVLPTSITSIEDDAFLRCEKLTNVEIPASVKTIGNYAFACCASLTNIKVAENSEYFKAVDGNLYSKDGKEFVYYAFGKDSTTFTIPNGVETICATAFYKCANLTSIEIPSSVKVIEEWAFGICDSLESVVIPNNVTTIGNSAFYKCTELANIEIPDSVKVIEGWAFYKCTSLTEIIIPNSVTTIGESAFYKCTSLINIKLSDNIQIINEWLLSGCTSLKTVEIPSGVTALGQCAFYECTALTEIVIPNKVTSIGDWAFTDCESLTKIVIPSSVKNIEYCAFSYCISLKDITISKGVEKIGDSAFYGCTSLESIIIPNSVISVGENIFSSCSKALKIYCEADNPLEGWNEKWNGYDKNEKYDVVYSYVAPAN